MPPTDNTALEFVRDALGSLRQDIRDLRETVQQSIKDADSRFEALEACPCPRAALQPAVAAPAEPKGFRGFLETYAWLPTAGRILWPVVIMLGMLWTRATPETKYAVKQVAADAAGVQMPQSPAPPDCTHTTKTDALSAASVAANADWWAQRAKSQPGHAR